MQNTGTSHLMAISGLHIALAASLIMLLLRGVQYILPGRWIGYVALVAGWRAPSAMPADHVAAGPAHLLRACGLLCFLCLSGQRWTAWHGVALPSGSDTGCRPAGGPVVPMAICLAGGGADLLVPVALLPAGAAGAGRGRP